MTTMSSTCICELEIVKFRCKL